jgi:hypothetical protein
MLPLGARLASMLQAVLRAGNSVTCGCMFSEIKNINKDAVVSSSQIRDFIWHEMSEIRETTNGKNGDKRHKFSQSNCREQNDGF